MKNDLPREASASGLENLSLPLEVRVHGRGGQGGVTCAKLIASLYTQMGLHVQTFGDYGSERSGAPIQAFTRVDRQPISNRNKVYQPDHLIVLDEALMGPQVLSGTAAGALLLLNTRSRLDAFAGQFEDYRFGAIDATAIAREHGIGSSSVVIINTTILGAYARLLGVPLNALEKAYASLGLSGDLAAAEHAYDQVQIRDPRPDAAGATPRGATTWQPVLPPVLPLTEHHTDLPATLKTGTWSTQAPRYREHAAPCNQACPAGNDIRGFIQALKNEGADAAARVLLRTQALPSVCGRVCPAPCMQGCNREAFDGAVNIRSLERWIADHSDVALERQSTGTPRHFAVIGGGPAGLSASYQLARRGHAVTLYEAGRGLGGVLRNGIPAYRLPPDVLQRDVDRITGLGVETRLNARLDREALARLPDDVDALLLCTGLGPALNLGVDGENLPGVEQGLDFLDRAKQGQVTLQGRVVVVGGGNTAIDCARTALRCGASSVKLVYRRSREEMPAIAEEIDAAEFEGVRLVLQRQPVAFSGNGSISAVVLAEVEPGAPDASGRRRPVVTSRTSTLDCDTVLLALGQGAMADVLPDDWQIRNGRIWHGDAALPVWLAGDCANGDGTVTHAIGNGRRTALAALGCLDSGSDGTVTADAGAGENPVAPGQIRFSHFDVAPPHRDKESPPSVRRNSFDECNHGLAGPEEAERCFSCGQCTHCDTCLIYCPEGVIARAGDGYRIDADYCKGCGMCVAECPRSAMEMHEKNKQEVMSCL
ncbi:FAD-dependent oxidoreductase [uncultured Propionivibrio sp.]|uniref:FAD-dependent oxidoreductase n=1 Tax=uncultured Propionivibrio sp. TaxID=426737 RepID=UPI0029BFFCF1|nr:FAD-dependent oxidoreductase [uncultured Propionivibrio sp.]